MIAPPREKPNSSVVPAENSARVVLPSFRRLLTAACYATAPFLALFLILGKPWWGVSVIAGLAMSAAVGGLLHLLISRAIGYFVAGLRGSSNEMAQAGSMLQFAALVLLKFILLAGIAWAIVSIHALNLLVVLAAFLIGHTAIIVTASRHLKQH